MVQKGAHLCGFSSETTHTWTSALLLPECTSSLESQGSGGGGMLPGDWALAPTFTNTRLSHLQPGPSVCFGPDEIEWQVDRCCATNLLSQSVSKLHIEKTAMQRSRNNVSLAQQEHKLVLLFF